MDNTILVEFKENYGREAIYIISHHAHAIYRLTGKKTIDRHDVEALKQLGFHVAVPAKMGLLL